VNDSTPTWNVVSISFSLWVYLYMTPYSFLFFFLSSYCPPHFYFLNYLKTSFDCEQRQSLPSRLCVYGAIN
jgi:hypothetical protein